MTNNRGRKSEAPSAIFTITAPDSAISRKAAECASLFRPTRAEFVANSIQKESPASKQKDLFY